MPILSNPRHERFAQELAKGRSASEAYEAAGFKRNDGNAGRLNRNEQIRARVAELQSEAAGAAVVTTQTLIAEAEAARIGAMAAGQFAAAIAAVKEKGILSGERVEKSERKNLNFDAADLTDAELTNIARRGGNGVAAETRGAGKSGRVH